jgi:hypothetical protein
MTEEAVMIRARASTRDALRELADAEKATLIEMLDRVVTQANEARLLAAVETTLSGHSHAIALETSTLDEELGAEGLDADEDFSDW